ncbi:MAG: hypothetical protein KW804_00485 [Candidatus Doudnabacteria bacterium]|nr:hypothetical protein [Candidatus Doudnabacteria bacterium]
MTISENHQYEDGVDLNVAYVMYARGITPRLDLYVGVGETNIFGQDQAWMTVGGSAKLFSVRNYSVSLFALASVPLHRFDEASTVLFNPAVVVSRAVTSKLSLYSGVNVYVPIGARSRGPFTPSQNKLNYPIGALVVLGDDWGLAAEADFGKLKAIGIAVSRVF